MMGADRLKAALSGLPRSLAPAIRGALEQMAAAAVARAKARLPPGPLADSLSVRGEGETVIVEADSPHAVFVEYGTRANPARPFIRPAAEAAAADGRAGLADAMTRAITEAMDRS